MPKSDTSYSIQLIGPVRTHCTLYKSSHLINKQKAYTRHNKEKAFHNGQSYNPLTIMYQMDDTK